MNKYLFSFSVCNSSCFSKHRTLVCRKLCGSGSAFSWRSRNYWWRGCSLLLPNAVHIFYIPFNSVLVPRGTSLVKSCCPAQNLHGSAGRVVPSSGFGSATDQTPKYKLTSPALFWVGDFLGSLRDFSTSPCHGLSSQIHPSGSCLSQSPPLLVQNQLLKSNMSTSVTMASRKRFLISPLCFIFYFNNS